MVVWSQPRQNNLQDLISKNKKQKNKKPSEKRSAGVAQSVGPEFKPQYHKR
jgi:hypothetical protein